MSGGRLWIDGVGCWLAWWAPRLSIGGPSSTDPADLALLAELQSLHAVMERRGEDYFLRPIGETSVRGTPITVETLLADGDRIRLGQDVELTFRMPSPLSASAVLELTSGHRPSRRIDGIVLLDQTCLLGPGSDQHIQSSRWSDSVVLFHREESLWVRANQPLQVNGQEESGAVRLEDGSIVRSDALSFRLEVEAEGTI